jgi:hypothetical protein
MEFTTTQGWNSFVEVLQLEDLLQSDIEMTLRTLLGPSGYKGRSRSHSRHFKTKNHYQVGVTQSVAGTISYLTDNSTNWNNAFLKEHNGTLNLVKATEEEVLWNSNNR